MGVGEREKEEGEKGENGYEWVKGALYTGLKYSVWKERQGLGVED